MAVAGALGAVRRRPPSRECSRRSETRPRCRERRSSSPAQAARRGTRRLSGRAPDAHCPKTVSAARELIRSASRDSGLVGGEDSNLRIRSQSPAPYRLATPHRPDVPGSSTSAGGPSGARCDTPAQGASRGPVRKGSVLYRRVLVATGRARRSCSARIKVRVTARRAPARVTGLSARRRPPSCETGQRRPTRCRTWPPQTLPHRAARSEGTDRGAPHDGRFENRESSGPPASAAAPAASGASRTARVTRRAIFSYTRHTPRPWRCR